MMTNYITIFLSKYATETGGLSRSMFIRGLVCLPSWIFSYTILHLRMYKYFREVLEIQRNENTTNVYLGTLELYFLSRSVTTNSTEYSQLLKTRSVIQRKSNFERPVGKYQNYHCNRGITNRYFVSSPVRHHHHLMRENTANKEECRLYILLT